jgi:hypothetical protein
LTGVPTTAYPDRTLQPQPTFAWTATLVSVVAACALHALWPGDVPFINDEPLLIEAALEANARGTLAVHGLLGTHGAVYGPLPTWIYQAYLACSHDLVALVALRALVSTALTSFAMLWLGRMLVLPAWFVSIAMCSPFLWLYGRGLWDNTFGIPLSALALASHVAFVANDKSRHLILTLALCTCLLLVHLMSLALIIPIGLHLLIVRGRHLLRHKWALSLTLLASVLSAWPYLQYLLAHGATGNGIAVNSWRAWVFPTAGAWHLSGLRLDRYLGPLWMAADTSWTGTLAQLAQYASLVAFPLSWAGMLLAIRSIREAYRTGTNTARTHALTLACGVLATQFLLSGLTGKYGPPHYFNATWVAYTLFTWLALDTFVRRYRYAAVVPVLHAASLLTLTVYAAVRVHYEGPSREGYGATLSNQLDVARRLSAYPRDSELHVAVTHYELFPQALRAVRAVLPPQPATRARTELLLTYETSHPLDGRIKLVEQ